MKKIILLFRIQLIKRHFTLAYVVLFICLTVAGCTTGDPSDTQDQENILTPLIVDQLNRLTVPLKPNPMNISDSELASLDGLGDAQVVGLGEATHGTREFFQMKHRIFQYLVENHGFKIFVIEADFGESLYIDDYVTGKRDDLEYLMKEVMYFWTWRTEEVRAFIRWMRGYNLGKPENQMIRYVGCDAQYWRWDLEWLENYLTDYSDDLEQELISIKEEIDDFRREIGVQETSDLERMETLLNELGNKMDQQKSSLILQSGEYRYIIARRLVDVIFQAIHCFYSSDNPINRELFKRDRFMAENVAWAKQHFGDCKVAVWAHNGHVAKNLTGGSMGHYLDEMYQDEYQVVGFAFAMGQFQARDSEFTGLPIHSIDTIPPDNSINRLFYLADDNNFHLDLNDILPDSELGIWISVPRNFLNIGAMYNGDPRQFYRAESLMRLYDHMIYFEVTTAARPLQ